MLQWCVSSTCPTVHCKERKHTYGEQEEKDTILDRPRSSMYTTAAKEAHHYPSTLQLQ